MRKVGQPGKADLDVVSVMGAGRVERKEAEEMGFPEKSGEAGKPLPGRTTLPVRDGPSNE